MGPGGETPAPLLLLQDGARFLRFASPTRVLEARSSAEVRPALAQAEDALRSGRWVAGFLAYEAAGAWGLATRPPDPEGPPVLWLGIFDEPTGVDGGALGAELGSGRRAASLVAVAPSPMRSPWRPDLDEAAHAAAVERLHDRIAAGDTYQVNYTFALRARSDEDPRDVFVRLAAAQRPRHAAFLDLGRFAVASASPELFFALEEGVLTARPMKGTAPRGPDAEADEKAAAALRGSEKERAENLMIVDMMRNDLGRVAEVGSVAVPVLFEVERYPTLLQMTSTVTGRTRAPLSAIFEALFPCASVTGAPKKRTMEIIAEVEPSPRGVYTGAIGWASPDGRARFSVAIRTIVVDRARGAWSFGVGSGVVADSLAGREYAECLLKARILDETPFALLETLAFVPGSGYRRLEGHLERLVASARYFGWSVDAGVVEGALRRAAAGLEKPHRIRLLVGPDGEAVTEAHPLPAPDGGRTRIGLAARPVVRDDARLRHKTTRREVYEAARASRPDCDDVLLWNEDGEVTETSVANVAFSAEGGLVTPPLASGLLAGVERAALLAEGRLREAVVRAADLRPGQRLWLLNSVRGLWEAEFVGQ